MPTKERIQELADKNGISFEQMKQEVELAKVMEEDIEKAKKGEENIENSLNYVQNAHKLNKSRREENAS